MNASNSHTCRPTDASSGLPIVCHVVVSLAHGGLERLVVDWTNARNRRAPGSTRIVCLDMPGELAALVEERGAVQALDATRTRAPWDRMAVRTLRAWLTGGTDAAPRVDVVHSHNTAAQQYAGLAAHGTGIPHVHTEHGTNVYGHGWKNRLRNAVMSRLTRCTIAVSDDTAAALARARIAPLRAIRVIPNGVAVEDECRGRYHVGGGPQESVVPRRLLIPAGAPVVGSVGRLATVKGYDRLLRAFAALASDPRAEQAAPMLLLIGDGPERDALEAQAAELGIADHVVFAGYHADARALLPGLTLFVLPSRSEGLSVALLEAMAAGIPVAVTAVGENRAVLDDGHCGVLLPDDEREWAAVLRGELDAIAAGTAEVAARVRRAHERVRMSYSLTTTLDAYERVYREARK